MPHGSVLASILGSALSSAGSGCRMDAVAADRAQRPTAQATASAEAGGDTQAYAAKLLLVDGVGTATDEGAVSTASAMGQAMQPRGASGSPQLLVQVLVESSFGQKATLPVSGSDTIRELKMRLANKSWFTSKHCLFFGGKELLDHDMVADMVNQVNASGNSNYLHVFVRAKDVRYGNISTSATSTSFGNLRALDDPETSDARSPPVDSFTPRHPQSNDDLALAAVSSPDAADLAPVLHIVIRKNSHVAWNTASRTGEFELTVRATVTADQLKQQLLPSSADDGAPALHSDINLFHNGVRLQADRPLLTYGLADGDVLDIVPWQPAARTAITASVSPTTIELHQPHPALSSPTHALYLSWQKAADGLRAGIVPELAPSGSGGSYFLRGPDHKVVAVFKPMDEEPNMRNNPRSLAHSPSSSPASRSMALVPACVRRGVLPGEGAHREIAAYLLDSGGRGGVPATAPVFLTYPDGSTKHGSLQEFVHSDCDCEEMGYSAFSVHEVHKIAVLDLRLCNADRNGSNILAARVDGEWKLTPIDHGFCLPDSWTDMAFVWSSWRQAEVPFDRDTVEYIMRLDAGSELVMLAEHGVHVRPACARIFKAATMVLKKVAARGLSPRAAADILERNTLRKSTMEKMHRVACEKALLEEEEKERHATQAASAVMSQTKRSTSSAMVPRSDDMYLKHLDQLLEEYLDEQDDDAIEFP